MAIPYIIYSTFVIIFVRDIDMAEFLSSDPAVQDAHPHTTYDLLANICHDGPAGKSAIVVVAIKACVLHSDIQVLIATSHYWPQAITGHKPTYTALTV